MLDFFTSPAFWTSLTALTFLEIVLGIDNLLFVSIAIGKLRGAQQVSARRVGIWGAMGLRILMLAGIFVIIGASKITLLELPEWMATAFSDPSGAHHEEFVKFTAEAFYKSYS